MCRREAEGDRQPFPEFTLISIRTVSQQNHRFPQTVQPFGHLRHRRRIRLLPYAQLLPFKPVECRIYLISAGIHHGADHIRGPPQIPGHPLQGRHRDQRLVQGQPKPFCRSGPDSQAGEGAGSVCQGDGIHTVQIQLRHFPDFLQHRQKGLGMGFLIVDRVFGNNLPILSQRHAGRHARAVNCQYLHNPSTTVIRR